MRAFHGARQDTRAAAANYPPGESTPGIVTPQRAAATMHDGLEDEARVQTGNGKSVPVHPACEGSDKQGYGGDAALHDPTGQGRGV